MPLLLNSLTMNTLIVCLVFSIIALGNACSHNPPKLSDKSEGRFLGQSIVHRYNLENGLKVLILEDHSSPTFSYQTWYNVGSRDEVVGLTGLAHLFEHMMFKATSHHPEGDFDRIMDSAGSENKNAFTNRDYTGYVQSMPTSRLELVVEMESDRMMNLLVNDQSLDKEREVVQNERRFREENSPDGTLYEKLNEFAFSKHPYHWPVIGYSADLVRAKAKDCYDFYKNHYSPNNATVVVVGDVDKDKTLQLIQKYYGPFKTQNVRRYAGAIEPRQKSEHRATLKLGVSVEKLYVAYRLPPLNHPSIPSIEVLNNVLGHSNSSQLYAKLVDRGIATSVDSFHDGRRDGGLLVIVANMQKGRKAAQALDAIDKAVTQLQHGEFSEEDISGAKAQYKYELFEDLETNFNKAKNLGFFETVAGRWESGVELVAKLGQVTKADVMEAAKTYLVSSQRTVLFGLPKGKGK